MALFSLARKPDLLSSVLVRPSEGAGTTYLSALDERTQIFNLSAARVCQLPSANIKKGDKWVISNPSALLSSNILTVQSSGGNTVIKLNACVTELVALQDAPTTAAHWSILKVDFGKCEWTAYTPTLGAGWNATNISFLWKRINGDTLEVSGYFQSGSQSSSFGTITLPSGLNLDITKLTIVSNDTGGIGTEIGMFWANDPSNTNIFGPIVTAPISSTSQVYTAGKPNVVDVLYPKNLTGPFYANEKVEVRFRVPISQWSLS